MFDNKEMERQARELAACAHMSINGFMRVSQKGDEYPITFCNEQVCSKLKRDPSNIYGADFHIVLPPDFEPWHRPLMRRWFENPRDLILDRLGDKDKPFEMVSSDGDRLPVAVFLRTRPAFQAGVMFGIEEAPDVKPGAWVEIVFLDNIFYYREFRKMIDIFLPHLTKMGYYANDTGTHIQDGGGNPAAPERVRAASEGVSGRPERRPVEPVSSNVNEGEGSGDSGPAYGESEFDTDGLDP